MLYYIHMGVFTWYHQKNSHLFIIITIKQQRNKNLEKDEIRHTVCVNERSSFHTAPDAS